MPDLDTRLSSLKAMIAARQADIAKHEAQSDLLRSHLAQAYEELKALGVEDLPAALAKLAEIDQQIHALLEQAEATIRSVIK